jgi:hypothetical protein
MTSVFIPCHTCGNAVAVENCGEDTILETSPCASYGVALCRACRQAECATCQSLLCDDCSVNLNGYPECAKCALEGVEAREPECTCAQTDVDLFDAAGCELCNESSAWRRALAAGGSAISASAMRQSLGGRLPGWWEVPAKPVNAEPNTHRPCVTCQSKPQRYASLYCSDACRNSFLNLPEVA